MRPWLPIVLLAAALAGCADAPAPAPADQDFSGHDLRATDTTGVLRGVVVDASITPVPGATVRVQGLDATAATGADGTFGFSGLEPGTHFLTVSRPGWTEVQQSATVRAGVAEPPVLRVLLEPVPGLLPRFEVQQQSGFLACGAATLLTVHAVCNDLSLNDDTSYLRFGLSGTPDWFQTELVWDSTQPLGSNLYQINYVTDADGGFTGDRIGEGIGESPMVHGSGREQTEAVGLGANGVTVGVFSGGPVLETGIALDQAFDVYVVAFYNLVPDEGYVFVTDGTPAVPA